jgi:hypothetical protein
MHSLDSVDEWLQYVSNKKILLIAEQDFFIDKFWSKLSERRERDCEPNSPTSFISII